MEGLALIKVWAAAGDEKPFVVTIRCPEPDATFGTVHAAIAHHYAAAHPDRPPLRFWPGGAFVATNFAREPVFHADQKVPSSPSPCLRVSLCARTRTYRRLGRADVWPFVVFRCLFYVRGSSTRKVGDVFAHCGCYNEIHVLDIQSLAAAQQEIPAPAVVPAPPRPPASRPQAPRTTIRCTNDGRWLSAKDIVCDALSLWGIHSALPQNTVRRMKDNHPDMFVKRALAGGGAHAPVIGTDEVALFCERCAASMAPLYAEAMRAYPQSTRCTESMAHVIERRARYASSPETPPPVRIRVRGSAKAMARASAAPAPASPRSSSASSSLMSMPPSMPEPGPPAGMSVALTSRVAVAVSSSSSSSSSNPPSPSASSSDSDGLLPEDGWSGGGDGCAAPLGSIPSRADHGDSHHRRDDVADKEPLARPSVCLRRSCPDNRRHAADGGVTDDEEDNDEITVQRPTKRRRTSKDAATAEQTHDAGVAARLMSRCANAAGAAARTADHTAGSLCVWKWCRDRRWRLVTEVRCTPDGEGAPWEVVRESTVADGTVCAPARGPVAEASTWVDARDLEALVRQALASPCDLVATDNNSRRLPSLGTFYADDGGRHDDAPLPGAAEGVDALGAVASALDGWLASACRRWVRAPEDRREGLVLFRRAVAFGVLVADTPYELYWTCLVEDMQNALA